MADTGTVPTTGMREVLTLQYLRGFAAMAVVIYHVQLSLARYAGNSGQATSRVGAAGVDLFFVISGFIMFHITHEKQPRPDQFLEARLLRILPLYWLATLAMFFMPLVSRTIGWSSTMLPRQLVSSLLCIGGIHWPGNDGDLPIYRAGWTINYEIFFYVIFSFALLVKPVTRSAILACTILFVLVMARYAGLAPSGIGSFYTAPILLEFAFGIGVGYLYLRRWLLPAGLAWMAIAGGSLLLYFTASTAADGFVKGLPVAMIVLGTVSQEQRAGARPIAPLKLLGDASYSIYLTHLFTVPTGEIIWHKIVPQLGPASAVLFALTSTMASVAVGVFCFYLVERPLHRWARRVARANGTGCAGRETSLEATRRRAPAR